MYVCMHTHVDVYKTHVYVKYLNRNSVNVSSFLILNAVSNYPMMLNGI